MANRKGYYKSLLTGVLVLLFAGGRLQAQQVLTKIHGWNAYVHLPDDYNSTNQHYPLIVFIAGIGEVGNNPDRMITYGPGHFIGEGHNMQFMVNGVLEKPIVISLQPPAAWPTPAALDKQLDFIESNWRVNPNRISLTGLSMGGCSWDSYVTKSLEYALRPASMVVMSAPPPASPVLNFALYALGGAKWWGFEGTQDNRQMTQVRDVMNTVVPGSAKYTKYDGGHCCWNTWYDPAYTENNENIYQWMLKQVRDPIFTPNVLPEANAGSDLVITLPTNEVTLSGTGTDADGAITSQAWTRVTGPASFTIVSPTAGRTTVTGLAEGVYQFRYQVTDNSGGKNADTVKVTVKAAPPPPNSPPVAIAGNNISITLPVSSVSLEGIGQDSDGSIAVYSWSKIAGPGQFSIVTPATANTEVKNLVAGTYRFRLQVKDNQGATAADTVVVTVKPGAAPPPPNQAPAAEAGDDQQIQSGGELILTGSASDPDGTIERYHWSIVNGPEEYTITDPDADITTVTGFVSGEYSFRLQVWDDAGASDADTVVIMVTAARPPANRPPVASAGSDRTITLPATSTSLTGSATDPDGKIETYRWSKVSGPATFAISNASAAQTTVTGLTTAGVYQFRLVVTDDDGATDDDAILITVKAAVNNPPGANAGADKTITLPVNSISVTGTATDSDGSVVSFKWTKISGPAAFSISNASSAQTSIQDLTAGTYRFRLEVRDNDGDTDADTLTVKVNPASNIPPVANAGKDLAITLPENSVILTASGTDEDGVVVTSSWTKISGPAVFQLSSLGSGQTAVTSLEEGVYVFRLEVQDDDGATDNDNVTVTVNRKPNELPVAFARSDKEDIMLPYYTVLQGSGTDADGTITAQHWRQINGPVNSTLANADQFETEVRDLEEGEYEFEFEVTDNEGAKGRDTVSIRVREPATRSSVAIYPNPSSGQDKVTLRIAGRTTTNLCLLRVYDVTGRLMYQESFIRSQATINRQLDIGRFQPGIYLVEVGVDINTVITSRLVKQ